MHHNWTSRIELHPLILVVCASAPGLRRIEAPSSVVGPDCVVGPHGGVRVPLIWDIQHRDRSRVPAKALTCVAASRVDTGLPSAARRARRALIYVRARRSVALVSRSARASEAPCCVGALSVGVTVVVRSHSTLIHVVALCPIGARESRVARAREAAIRVGALSIVVAVVRRPTLVHVRACHATVCACPSSVALAREAPVRIGALALCVAVVRVCRALVHI
eukprot:815250-Rhodomonas_salina.3